MAKRNNPGLKKSWTKGVIYAVVIIVLSALTVYFGLYNAMPYELVVYDSAEQAVSVLFTDDYYNSSMELIMVSVVFPAAAYLVMYALFTKKADEHSHELEKVKKDKFCWVMPLIVLVVCLLVWGGVSMLIISLGMGLDTSLFADSVMLRQYCLVYGIAFVVELLLYLVGMLLFKPQNVQGT